jgi:hypothetical protein
MNKSIYINGNKQTILSILQETNSTLELELHRIYDITLTLQHDISNRVNELNDCSFDMIHYSEPTDDNKDSTFNIIPLYLKCKNLTFETIISYIYKYELSMLNIYIPNHKIIYNNNSFILKQIKCIEYIKNNEIIKLLADTIKNDVVKMKDLQELIANNIFHDYIIKTNIHNISCKKLCMLYECMDIEYDISPNINFGVPIPKTALHQIHQI